MHMPLPDSIAAATGSKSLFLKFVSWICLDVFIECFKLPSRSLAVIPCRRSAECLSFLLAAAGHEQWYCAAVLGCIYIYSGAAVSR